MTEGGDFVLSGRSEPLWLSVPHARNFVLCLTIYNQLYIHLILILKTLLDSKNIYQIRTLLFCEPLRVNEGFRSETASRR